MTTNPQAQIASSVGTVIGAATGVTSTLVAAAVSVGPISGRAFTERGAQQLREARDLIFRKDKDGPNPQAYIVPATSRNEFYDGRIKGLMSTKRDLEDKTQTTMGSVRHLGPAFNFYRKASEVRTAAERLSGDSYNEFVNEQSILAAEHGEHDNLAEPSQHRSNQYYPSRDAGKVDTISGSPQIMTGYNTTVSHMYPPPSNNLGKGPILNVGLSTSPIERTSDHHFGRSPSIDSTHDHNSGRSHPTRSAGSQDFARVPYVTTTGGQNPRRTSSIQNTGGQNIGRTSSIDSVGAHGQSLALRSTAPSIKSPGGRISERPSSMDGAGSHNFGHSRPVKGPGGSSVKSAGSQDSASGRTSSIDSTGSYYSAAESYYSNTSARS